MPRAHRRPSKKLYPDYYEIVPHPIALNPIRRKIEKPGGGGGAAGGGAVADAAGVRPEPDWASSTVPLKRSAPQPSG